eukprot:4539637-Alexandrium_andersonii.AAC.1
MGPRAFKRRDCGRPLNQAQHLAYEPMACGNWRLRDIDLRRAQFICLLSWPRSDRLATQAMR